MVRRGTLLNGRYRVTGRIGGGAMGDVWRAEDETLTREVAIKVLSAKLSDDASFLDRFRREARLLAALKHPNVVGVHDYGEEETEPEDEGEEPASVAFIVMELVDGRPLDAVLAEAGTLPPERVLAVAAEALDGLHAAHLRDIVHRDVKPSNLMLGEGDRVTVTDFGIARPAAGTKITDGRSVLGTALYMAPEQAEGRGAVPASDLYAMGVVCYQLLTGTTPFTGEAPVEILFKHVREPVPELPEAIPEPVRRFVMRALAKAPEDRYADASAMAATARRLAGGGAWHEDGAEGAEAAGREEAEKEKPEKEEEREERREDGKSPARGGVLVDADRGDADADAGDAAKEPLHDPAKEPAKDPAEDTEAHEAGKRAPVWRRPRPMVLVLALLLLLTGTVTLVYVEKLPWRTEAGGAENPAPGGTDDDAANGSAGADGAADPEGEADEKADGGDADDGSEEPEHADGEEHAEDQAGGEDGGARGGGDGGAGGSEGASEGGSPGGGSGDGGSGSDGAGGPSGGGDPDPGGPAAGCGGENWGQIVNVADGLPLGLAEDEPRAGGAVISGGNTSHGWVRTTAYHDSALHVCEQDGETLAAANGGDTGAFLGSSFGGGLFPSAQSVGGAHTIGTFGGKCLTSQGAGQQPTMATCVDGDDRQRWRLP
ncbi:serine/threonine protein kinase [Streptomyces zhaozhouensis]|uniref:non-specific serine/threonine protein kinase n=1 Tax=Streptomyces zhaozhouensis TaxID=1300267 RepID=A0A286DTK7_9ACTN|nr:serine/threonine-protein kinase [Streptomyces zhaozhouensis]SOD61999.1 serine/threonine protein kinase [Streptomyces zhaozhouensis]